MLAWGLALGAGLLFAALAYAGRVAGRRAPLAVVALVLRAAAAALLVALLLDAAVGPARVPDPLVALDVSASWLRGGDTAAWRAAADSARAAGGEPLLLVGDSLRAGGVPDLPAAPATRVRPAVERALAAGRALVLVTDGEPDDPELLARLPQGSRAVVLERAAGADAAPLGVVAPRAAVGGDTIRLRARVGAGAGGARGARVHVLLDDTPLDSAQLGELAAFGEETAELTLRLPRREGPAVLRVVTTLAGDTEPRNDTLATTLELSEAAGVTVVSTAPDFDLRFMLEVLRGTVALPTRAYVQVAPGRWRDEGTLAPVEVETVRRGVRQAPIVVLHGDTAAFGAPAAATSGAHLLVPTPAASAAEWYAVAAPPSPLAAALSGAVWDSLPPLAVGSGAPRGEWTGLEVRRGRQFERQAAIAGTAEPRRRAVVGVAGLWRWRFRGGVAADAFGAVWGGLFDWLAAERRDARAALPDAELLREGEPVRWRRGGTDSVAAVVLRRRGGADSLPLELRFATGVATTTSPPLPAGVYDVQVPGGATVLVVNPTRELVPHRPGVRAGALGSAPAPVGTRPTLRGQGWAYVLLVLLLCAEWIVRRRVGLR